MIINRFENSGSSSSTGTISGEASFDFQFEQNTVVSTILNANLTVANLLSFSAVNLAFGTTTLTDFNLNGLSFNIENIVDSTSFQIRANASNNASGVYKIKYIITYSN